MNIYIYIYIRFKQVLIFFKYILLSLVKTKAFWFISVLYFLMITIFNYLIPILLKREIHEIYHAYTALFVTVLFTIVIVAINNTLFVFKQGFSNGLELLIQSKPLTKTIIIWSKILSIFVLACAYGIITMLLNSFLLLTSAEYTQTLSVIIGGFIGTFINYLFWSAITILFATFAKNIIVFIIVLGFCLCLQIYSGVISIFSSSIKLEILKEEHIEPRIADFFYKDDQHALPDYTQYTIIKNSPFSHPVDPNPELLNYYINRYEDKLLQTHNNLKAMFDINQILSLSYYWYYDHPNAMSNIITGRMFAYEQYKWDFYFQFMPSGDSWKERINLLDRIYLLSNISSEWREPIAKINNNQYILQLPYFNPTNNKIEITQPITSLKMFNDIFYSDAQISLATKIKTYVDCVPSYYLFPITSYIASEQKYNSLNMYTSNKSFQYIIEKTLANFYFHTFEVIQDYFEHANNGSNQDIVYLQNNYPNVKENTIRTWFDLFNKKDIRLVPKQFNNYTYYLLSDDSLTKEEVIRSHYVIFLNKERIEKFYSDIIDDKPFNVNDIMMFAYSYSQGLDLLHKDRMGSINKIKAINYFYENSQIIYTSIIFMSILIIILSTNIIYCRDIY